MLLVRVSGGLCVVLWLCIPHAYARRLPETLLVYGVVGDDWQHFFYALFRYSSSAENRNFCRVALKCCYCRVALRAVWLSERVGNLFLSPAFSLVRTSERGATRNASCGATAFPGTLFRCSLAADTVILPCFRFRKGNLYSAVEGTPKGVQKCYAPVSQSALWLSGHQLCFRFPPPKDKFFSQLMGALVEVNSPFASTLCHQPINRYGVCMSVTL